MGSRQGDGSGSDASRKSEGSQVKHREIQDQIEGEVSCGRYTYSDSRPATPRILPKLPVSGNPVLSREVLMRNQTNRNQTNLIETDNSLTENIRNIENTDMNTLVQDINMLSLS